MPDLGDLLHDAVDDIEPADRLDAIRARVAASPPRTRRWWYAGGGAALATAAAVAAFAVLGGPSGSPDRAGSTATSPSTAATPTPGTTLVPAYFVSDTPRGPRLFREWDHAVGFDALEGALALIQRPASDPDYRTLWSHGSLDSAQVRSGTIAVALGAGQVPEDPLALQQLVYTLQGAAGQRLPVQLLRDGEPVGAPMTALPQTDVLSQVMVNDPTEGLAVGAGFTARGAANSFEANVPWQIRDESGAVVEQGHATAAGWGDRLYPWSVRIDVRDLPAGVLHVRGDHRRPVRRGGPGTRLRHAHDHRALIADLPRGWTHEHPHPDRRAPRRLGRLARRPRGLRRRRDRDRPASGERLDEAARPAGGRRVAERVQHAAAGPGRRAGVLRRGHVAGASALPRVPPASMPRRARRRR